MCPCVEVHSTEAGGVVAVIAVLLDLRFMQEGLVGAGIGALFGRYLIHRAERRDGELSPKRVRQLDFRWTCFGVSVAILRALLSRLP